MICAVFRALVRPFKTDLHNAMDDLTLADAEFPARFLRAAEIIAQSNANFNAGAPAHHHRSEKVEDAITSLVCDAQAIEPERRGQGWYFFPLPEALQKTVDATILNGILYTSQADIDHAVVRLDRAARVRDTIGYKFGLIQ